MSLYLTVVNLAAFVGAAIALIRYRRRRVEHDDVGRALMVCLTALLFLAAAGLTRRAQLVITELAVAAAWTSATVVAWWTAMRRTPTSPPEDRE